MADNNTDVLMTFLTENGGGVPAECQAIWAKDDAMKTDFTQGNFFEIEDFSIDAGIESDDSSEEDDEEGRTQGLPPRTKTKSSGGNSKEKSKKARRGNKFGKYVKEGLRKDGGLLYPIDLQEVSVSRLFDKASPGFLQSCLTLTPFRKAVIVKRKVVGNSEHQGFLRMEFYQPLITSVEWDDDEVVKEKLKFVCRGIKVTYRTQKNDGNLNPEGAPGQWYASSDVEESSKK